MTQKEFFMELDYCYAQLNQVTVETAVQNGEVKVTIEPKPVTMQDVETVKVNLRKLLTVAAEKGWYKV